MIAFKTSIGLVPFIGYTRLLLPIKVEIPMASSQVLRSWLSKLERASFKKKWGVYRFVKSEIGSEWVRLKPPFPATKNFLPKDLFFSKIVISNLDESRNEARSNDAGPPPIIDTDFFTVQ